MRPLIVLLLVLIAAVALIVALNTPTKQHGDSVVGPQAPAAVPNGPSRPDNVRQPQTVATQERNVVGSDPAPTTNTITSMDPEVDNRLVGHVLDAAGKPLPDATVLLSRDALQGEELQMRLILGLESKGQPISTKTNNKGEYIFRKVEPARDYYIVARHPEYAERQEQMVVVGDVGEFRGPDITLKAGSVVFGTITDVGGNMVREATLQLDSAFYSGEGESPGRVEAKTDRNGYYEMKNVVPNSWVLTVLADGYGTVVKGGIQVNGTPDERVECSVALDVGQPIAGRVVSTDGSGVPKAMVKAFFYSNNLSYRGETLSQEDGSFQIDNLNPEGQYMLQVDALGWSQQKATRVKVGEMSVEIVMVPQACVAGRVLDLGGAPIANFECAVRRVSAPQPNGMRFYEDVDVSQAISTEADGTFELCGLNAGSYVVVAKAEGFAPTLSDVFNLAEGQPRVQIDVRLALGGSIKGRVIGADGAPLAGATVSTHSDTFEEDAIDSFFENLVPTNVTERKVRTDANGEFEITLLTPETYQVRVLHRDYTDGKVRAVNVVQGSPTDLGTIKMQVGGTVRGTVFNQAGEPTPKAFVHLEAYQGEKTYSTRADASGNFVITHVRPGPYTLSATGVATEGTQALGAIIDQRASMMEITVTDGTEVVRELKIGG